MAKLTKQTICNIILSIAVIVLLRYGNFREQKVKFQHDEDSEIELEKIRTVLNCKKFKRSNLKLKNDDLMEEENSPIYVITPTFPRRTQIPELTRLGQSLKLVKNLVWIVAEDAKEPTMQVIELLNDLDINYQYLQTPMPKRYKKKDAKSWPKGVENRNKAVEWILEHVKESGDDSGVFYFADDDNTYDVRIFEEMRRTKKVSLFPVGIVSDRPVSTPMLSRNGTLINFYEGWLGNRTFPVDMAGFAVNVKHFISVNSKNKVRMAYKKGYEEDSFLKELEVLPKDVEFLASNCSKIYVWHTKTQDPSFKSFKKLDVKILKSTNLGGLLKYWCLFTTKDQPCLEDDDTFDDSS